MNVKVDREVRVSRGLLDKDRCDECNRVIIVGHYICDNCAAYIAGAYFFQQALLDNEIEV